MGNELRNGVHASTPLPRVPTFECQNDLGHIRLILVPPGPIDTRGRPSSNLININYSPAKLDIATNSDKLNAVGVAGNEMAFFPTDTDIRMRVYNLTPSCLLDISNARMSQCFDEAGVTREQAMQVQPYKHDGIGSELGRAALRHLAASHRGVAAPDRLLGEAIGLAIAARVVARAAAADGDVDTVLNIWSRQGDSVRINKAIDFAEAHITDPSLSVSQMADVAALAPSHFSAVFKAMTGETVYKFILRRRIETARDRLLRSNEELSVLASGCGFSSQAHMTAVFKKYFGCTPSRFRRGNL